MTAFENSETAKNLMRAFAGESQARNRYTIAASQAKEQKLPVVQMVFTYTADQEKEHAEIFYDHLKDLAGETIIVDGGYPVDIYKDVSKLLRAAEHNEMEEHDVVYSSFAKIAREEGFKSVAASFEQIAGIEKIHSERFAKFAEWMEQGKLFVSDVETGWICLNCGYVYYGKEAPKACPVCRHEQGYFIRLEFSPFAAGKFIS
ncbi:rubrerythrin [Cuneatibacter caecimuris]|uniref:Rubrerythrin n=1 Tax=Cuneatibacter caecimuris TaxID=1796618 RepID=A0A4Q7PMV3_9FIRM|nr:rubrerythrin family protein [Cuneatibacter caecimuris]RZT02269.1 rubrerythrin [Cuneatibacter caecimuris]